MIDLITNALTKFAATPDCKADQSAKLLGIIPKWYEYLNYNLDPLNKCAVNLNLLKNNGQANAFSPFLLIGLAVLDMLMHVAGIVAIGYIVYGGIQYVISQGEPDRVEKAKSTLLNALIGLVIVIIAIPIVGFIGNTLGGK